MLNTVFNGNLYDWSGKKSGRNSGNVKNTSVIHAGNNLYRFNVRKFGAIGDGVSDDTEAIQSAFNAAEKGTTVFFPEGKYLIHKTIHFRSCVNIVGVPNDDGFGGSTLVAGQNIDMMISPFGARLHANTIRNMTFDGGKSEGYTVRTAIDAPGINGVNLSNIRFCNITGTGLDSYQGTKPDPTWICVLENIEYTNGDDYALKLINSDTSINHVHIHGGLGLLDYNYGGNCYNDINIDSSLGSGITIGRDDRDENGCVTIANSTFTGNAVYGLKANSLSHYRKLITCVNCEFSDNKTADAGVLNVYGMDFNNCNFKSATPLHYNGTTEHISFLDCDFAVDSLPDGKDFNLSACKSGMTKFLPKGTALDFEAFDYRMLNNYFALRCPSGKCISITAYIDADPTHDCADGIQAAADSLSDGGILFFPARTYLIGKTVTVGSNIVLLGESTEHNSKFHPLANLEYMFRLKDGAHDSAFINFRVNNDADSGFMIDKFFGGNNISNCMFYSINSDSNIVRNIKSMIYIGEGSHNCSVCDCTMGIGNMGTMVELDHATNCAVLSSYISRGNIGTIVRGGQFHLIYNNHYDWFYDSAVKFIDCKEPFYSTVIANYNDINQTVLNISLDNPCDAYIYCANGVFRESGIPARAHNGGKERELSEVHICNARHVWVHSCTSECPTPSKNDNMFHIEGKNDYLSLCGNTLKAFALIDSDSVFGEHSKESGNVIYRYI